MQFDDDWGVPPGMLPPLQDWLDDPDTNWPLEQQRHPLPSAPQKALALSQRVGDLGVLARRMALQKLPASIRPAAQQKLAELEEELGYAESPRLERLLIEQVLSCWLHLYLAEMTYGPTALTVPPAEPASTLEKRLNGAHRRYLRSLEMLARMRQQFRPDVLQVNIGAQQVNLAGDTE